MSDIAIQARGVSKQYRLGVGGWQAANYKRLTEIFTDLLAAPWKHLRLSGRESSSTFWALKDVSFDVHHGEARIVA
jgi:ABC-type polysaccharide/polyol phosphate transport system ATPase subunit